MYIEELVYYPIKSAKGIHADSLDVSPNAFSMDRRLLITNHKGEAVTAREQTQMGSIEARLKESGLKTNELNSSQLELSRTGSPTLCVDMPEAQQATVSVRVWGRPYEAQDLGDQAAHWIGQQFSNAEDEFRLVYLIKAIPNDPEKAIPKNFVDIAPVLILSQASIDELNKRLPLDVDATRFRPNILVSDSEAHAEDSWKTIRIGDTLLSSQGPCPRCVMTTINPQNGHSDLNQEPMRSLGKYRKSEGGEILFGSYFSIIQGGRIDRNAEIEVLEYQQPPALVQAAVAEPKPETAQTTPSPGTPVIIRCNSIVNDNNQIKRFLLSPDENRPVQFQAGQFAVFSQTVKGEQLSRCYSFSAPLDSKGNLEISIKKLYDGKFSQWMHQHFEVGDTLSLQTVSGEYTLDDSNKALLLLAAGSGITPNIAIARELLKHRSKRNVVFLYTAASEHDIAFQEILQRCQETLENFTLILNFSQSRHTQAAIHGRLKTQSLFAAVPDIHQRDVYFCGPPSYQKSIRNMLETLKVNPDSIRSESFYPEQGSGLTEGLSDMEPTEHTIRFERSEHHASSNNRMSLLQAALKQGIEIPYACQLGACGSCAIDLLSGKVNTMIEGVAQEIDADVQNGEKVLACCSYPSSDVVLDC